MDDTYAIRLAKTELRDAYNQGNVKRVLTVFADAYSDMSAGMASFYGTEAKTVLKHRLKRLFMRHHVELAVTIISIRIQGPLAFDWGWHKLTLTPRKGGRSITTRTRYHAGLDVFNIEPLPADHPLAKLPNVTLSAHSAFRTPEASENLIHAAWEHCRRIAKTK